MTNPRDIFLQQFKPALDDKENRYPPFRAVLTSSAGATDTGDVWKDENARLVWFRAWGGAAPAWALCDVLEPTLGLGVYIKFNPDINQYEVLRDDPLMRSPSSDRTSYRAITDQDLLKGGRFQLWLDPTMFIPLSIYPTAADTVNVVSGDYILGGERLTFAGAVGQDLSASRPAVGFHRFVGFYLDDTATLATIDGATVATGTDAIEPVWPAGVLRVGVVDIDNATAISIDNIDNRKVIYTEDDETGAINVWPRADEVNINFTPYAGWALAVDALDASEQAIIGEGTYLSDNERIDVAAFIKGSGVDVSILSTTTKDRVLELATDPIILEDFTLSNIYTATLYGDYYAAFIDENASIDAFRVKFVVTGSGGNINYGCYIASAGTHRFAECIWDVRNGTANYALYMDAQGLYSGAVVDLFDPDITGNVHNEDGTLKIHSGIIDGDVYAGDGATINLYNPVITGTVSSHAGGTIYGQYQDSNGVTRYIGDTTPSDKQFPKWTTDEWIPGYVDELWESDGGAVAGSVDAGGDLDWVQGNEISMQGAAGGPQSGTRHNLLAGIGHILDGGYPANPYPATRDSDDAEFNNSVQSENNTIGTHVGGDFWEWDTTGAFVAPTSENINNIPSFLFVDKGTANGSYSRLLGDITAVGSEETYNAEIFVSSGTKLYQSAVNQYISIGLNDSVSGYYANTRMAYDAATNLWTISGEYDSGGGATTAFSVVAQTGVMVPPFALALRRYWSGADAYVRFYGQFIGFPRSPHVWSTAPFLILSMGAKANYAPDQVRITFYKSSGWINFSIDSYRQLD